MLRRNSFRHKLLSVVVPAYKQEKTIIPDVLNIKNALDELKVHYEIIVVVDGILDKTHQNVLKLKSSHIKVIAYEKNMGKGHAVRFGMMHAKGDVIGFIDAGMDIHPAGFNMLLNHMEWYNADIICGSKLHPVSKIQYPIFRTVLSWGYRLLTFTLFGFKVRDTQVGMKFFKRDVIRNVLPRLLVKRYAFDIEILAVAHALGYTRIYEAPIEINFSQNTMKMKNLAPIIFFMLWDTFAVYYRLNLIHYYTHKRVAIKNKRKKMQRTYVTDQTSYVKSVKA